MTPEERLFKYGWLKKDADPELRKMDPKKREAYYKRKDKSTQKELLKLVHPEKRETADNYVSTDPNYPYSNTYYRLVHEAPNSSIEEGYFWLLEFMRQDRGYIEIEKVSDVYDSSQASAFWGNQQQRITAQQNQAQQLLANIGKFVKELFQMVRELRIIDERLHAYDEWGIDEEGNEGSPSADVTLKSIFTDMVEGGTKNPQSVFGLSQTVGFTLLPDLFFNTHVYSHKELDKTIENMEYNTSVKNVLRRKLYQFISWKEETHRELKNRRTFNIRYLNQHFGIIKMYINWAKPYLKNVQALKMRQSDKDPDMVKSFDTNITEVELIGKRAPRGGYTPVSLVSFQFRTRPDMNVRKEYQTGPSHNGRLQIEFRSYAWTQDQIDAYVQMRNEEEIEMIGLLDDGLAAMMDALKDDLMKYLDEMKHVEEQEKDEDSGKKGESFSKSARSAAEPFTAVFGGFAEIYRAFVPKGKKKSSGKGSPGKAAGDAAINTMLLHHIYKKAHRMIAW